jgi:hypothetical protein
MSPFGPFRIRGRPGVPASDGLRPWQELVREQVAPAWGSRPLVSSPVRMDIRFFLEPQRLRDTDIDNLIKGFFDGLAGTVFPRNPRGNSEWDADDVWVYRVTAEKLPSGIPEDLGAEFEVVEYAQDEEL